MADHTPDSQDSNPFGPNKAVFADDIVIPGASPAIKAASAALARLGRSHFAEAQGVFFQGAAGNYAVTYEAAQDLLLATAAWHGVPPRDATDAAQHFAEEWNREFMAPTAFTSSVGDGCVRLKARMALFDATVVPEDTLGVFLMSFIEQAELFCSTAEKRLPGGDEGAAAAHPYLVRPVTLRKIRVRRFQPAGSPFGDRHGHEF